MRMRARRMNILYLNIFYFRWPNLLKYLIAEAILSPSIRESWNTEGASNYSFHSFGIRSCINRFMKRKGHDLLTNIFGVDDNSHTICVLHAKQQIIEQLILLLAFTIVLLNERESNLIYRSYRVQWTLRMFKKGAYVSGQETSESYSLIVFPWTVVLFVTRKWSPITYIYPQ